MVENMEKLNTALHEALEQYARLGRESYHLFEENKALISRKLEEEGKGTGIMDAVGERKQAEEVLAAVQL